MNLRINHIIPGITSARSLVIVAVTCLFLFAPFGAAAVQSGPDQENTLGVRYLKNLFSDQKAIWTSPAQIRQDHLPWLIPFVSVSGGLFATDSNVAKQVSRSPSLISNSRNLANAGVASMVAGGAGFYLYGRVTHDEHARETGVLSSEAAIDSVVVAEVLKTVTGRERPSDNVRGRFFQ
ncbi:MAG TPA: hypothetical protein VG649_00260, partial [Candidatus Angelobacter sp.]|nr:hypothetical protein [Candidatus Angelobacter sp.]